MFKRYLAASAAVLTAVLLAGALSRVPLPEPASMEEGPSAPVSRQEERQLPQGASSVRDLPSSAVAAPPPSRPAQEAPSSSGPGYYIKDWEGRVSIIQEGADTPEMIFDIYTRLLPEYDQEQLRQGLYVSSYEELAALIEDYIS